MDSEAIITNVTDKLQKKKNSGYNEDTYNRILYSHVNLMLHVFSGSKSINIFYLNRVKSGFYWASLITQLI